MDMEKLAFWGIEVKPGVEAPLELRDGEVLHVSMATLGEKVVDKSGRSVISARVGDDPEKHALCVLVAGKTESFSLDLTFAGDEKVVLEASGKNPVHLVGNFGYEGEEMDDGDSDDELINVYDEDGLMGGDDDDDDDDSGDDDDSDSDVEPELLPDSDPPVITEISDDKVKAITAGPGKKSGKSATKAQQKGSSQDRKLANGGTSGKASKGNDADMGSDSEEQSGDAIKAKKDQKPSAAQASKGKQTPNAKGGKKRASADAGNTPGGKKAKTEAGPSSQAAAQKSTPAKAKKDKDANGPAGSSSGGKANGKNATSSEKGTGGNKTNVPVENSEGESGADSGKKKRRRRKSKGGGTTDTSAGSL